MDENIDERILFILESIDNSLKMIAEKPPAGIILELTDSQSGFKQSDMIRDLALAEERNTKVQKWCTFCSKPFLGDKDTEEPFCEDHQGAEL